jgi:M6 family metalloprotease-like protein
MVLLFLTANMVAAAPSAPNVVTLSQPDGIAFEAIPWGDEWLNGMETLDGYTILRDPQSAYWIYATLGFDGNMSPQRGGQTPLIVGKDEPLGLPKHIRPEIGATISRSSASGDADRTVGRSHINLGTQEVLVLLVDFPNRPGQTLASDWAGKVFGPTNSLGHYYYDVSFGNLTLAPASESSGTANDGVVGWLRLPYNHPNTAGNLGQKNLQLVQDAIEAADAFVNFAAYDSNGDGYLSYDELHVMVIVAGQEAAYGGEDTCPPSVWAHQYYLDYTLVSAPVVDGVRVASYAGGGGYTQFGEIHCDSENAPGHPATIGIIAHEFGHDLQWPDLYDTSFISDSAGIGNWGLMGTGMWNRNTVGSLYPGEAPANPTAWSRWYQGWITPTQITASTLNVAIPPVGEGSGTVLLLRDNPNGVDWIFERQSGVGEYFLIENRQKIGYDLGLPGDGLLIWHIDESVVYNNFANSDQNRRLVDLVQADGLGQLNIQGGNRGDTGDPYPGLYLNRTFNASSVPSSNLHGGLLSGVSLKKITQDGDWITANVFVNTFADVLPSDWFWQAVETLVASGLTSGCGEGNYCPQTATPRAQMAVLLLRAKFGPEHSPNPAIGLFDDLNPDYWAINWIEELYTEGVTAGCGVDPLRFCPEDTVTRAEMAIFLLRGRYGSDYLPPTAEGIFSDLNGYEWATDWIEALYKAGITSGCSLEPLKYCPEKPITRAELAVFLARTFNLPMP